MMRWRGRGAGRQVAIGAFGAYYVERVGRVTVNGKTVPKWVVYRDGTLLGHRYGSVPARELAEDEDERITDEQTRQMPFGQYRPEEQ